MRRAGNIFEDVLDRGNIRIAFLKASRGKRLRADQQIFQANLDDELERLREGLADGTYPVGNYMRFKVFDPKEREICAASFGKRVLHHALMNVCEPYFDKWLVDRSYACRRGYGQLRAVRMASRLACRYRWYLKCDFCRFFDSIPHSGLKSMLHRKFKDDRLVFWFEKIISAYETSPARGLPIGNLTSQHLANLYLDPLDRMAGGRYVRYMDDFILWSEDKESLRRIKRDEILAVCSRLGLTLKNEPILNRSALGMDFLGMRILPGNVRLSRRSRDRYERRLRWYDHQLAEGSLDESRYQERVTALTAFVLQADSSAWRRWYFGGRREASGPNRVIRGGSYNNDASNCTSSYRNSNNPSNNNDNNGFRLACSAAPQETAVPVGIRSSCIRGEHSDGPVQVGSAECHGSSSHLKVL